MATFQSFFQSGRAKDLSAPLYLCQTHTLRDNKTEGTYREVDSQFGEVFQLHTARA